MLLPGCHDVEIPDDLDQCLPSDPLQLPNFDEKRKALTSLLQTNGVQNQPILVVDPATSYVDWPFSIAVTEHQTAEETLSLFCQYVCLDRRKPINTDDARGIARRCLDLFKLRQLHFQSSKHKQPSASIPKILNRYLPPIENSRPGFIPPPKQINPSFQQPQQSSPLAPWLTSKDDLPILVPEINHWWIHLKSLTWEDFIRKAYYLIDYPHGFLQAEGETVKLRNAILRVAGFWFQRIIVSLAQPNTFPLDSRLDWEITEELVCQIFQQFP